MLTLLIARLGAWLEFHSTLAALRRLDPHLRSDLGLTDADLARIARHAVGLEGPISVYRLVREDFGAEAEPLVENEGRACGPMRMAAQAGSA